MVVAFACLVSSLSWYIGLAPYRGAVGPLRTPLVARMMRDANTGAEDVLIDKLMRTPGEAVPAVMGQRIDVMLRIEFMEALEMRIAGTTDADELDSLEMLRVSAVDFAEEVAEGVQRLEPDFTRWTAEEAAAKREAAAAVDPVKPPRRRAAADVAAAFIPQLPKADGVDAEERERARGRFRLQKLLLSASISATELDARLLEMLEGGLLDSSFFEHLQWEVNEQIDRQNTRLLGILELVVQRACLQVEADKPEVAILSALLQTRDRLLRAEIFERRLVSTSKSTRARFATTVSETQVALEQAVLRGQKIDRELLLQLRLIGVEMEAYVA